MKKILAVLTVVAVICAGSAAFAAGKKAPIKVGYLSCLTGDYAAYGITEVNTAKMALKEINDAGGVLGRPIQFIIYDTKSRVEDAVSAVRRMIDQDKVCAIIGSDISGIDIATAPIVTKKRIPQIATLATNPIVTVDEKGRVRPYSFRICFTDPYQGKLAADLAVTDLKKKRAAVLYNVGSDYAQGLRQFFTERYKKLGGKIVADEGYRDTDVDFRAQLTKVKSSGANVLFLPGMGKDMGLIIKQAREMGLKEITIVGCDGYAAFMSEIAGRAMVGTYWVTHTYLDDPTMLPVFKRYKKIYKDECKEFANGTMAYDATKWLAWAIKRAGKADGPAIRDALENTKGLKLTHATITINPKDHTPINKPGVILKVDSALRAQFYKKVQPK